MTLSEDLCKGIKTLEQMEALCREHHSEIVAYMLEKYKKEITKGKKPLKKPTVYVIGGQNASGKSKLIEQLQVEKGGNSVSIIIDDMKAYHPFRKYIDGNFIDNSEDLLHPACFAVFDDIFEQLLSEGYDITIERTLGSTDKAKDFIVKPANHKPHGTDYDIQIHVTATHEINSLLSALERFVYECNLKDHYEEKEIEKNFVPRPIAIEHHDGTYGNICDVVNACENGYFKDMNGNPIHPTVNIWDRTPKSPTRIYKTGEKQYSCAKEAMVIAREKDLQRCAISDDPAIGYEARLANLEGELANPGPTLQDNLEYCKRFIDALRQRAEKYPVLRNRHLHR